MERIRCARAMCCGIGKWLDDLQLLNDRARPAMRDDERQRIFMFRTNVDEMDVQPIDLGDEVRQSLQPRLAVAPVVLCRPIARERLHRRQPRAATPHNSRGHALPCCGGGDRQDHRRECDGTGTTQGGRTMSNDLKAFALSVGGLLAVAGSGLLVLWAVLS